MRLFLYRFRKRNPFAYFEHTLASELQVVYNECHDEQRTPQAHGP